MCRELHPISNKPITLIEKYWIAQLVREYTTKRKQYRLNTNGIKKKQKKEKKNIKKKISYI